MSHILSSITLCFLCSGLFAFNASADCPEATYDVKSLSYGSSNVNTIKAVKSLTGLGLKDAKELVESAPVVIREGLTSAEAETWKTTIESAGAAVELVGPNGFAGT